MTKKQDMEELVAKRTKDLEEANSYINSVLDNLIDGVITINTKGLIRTINPAVTSIFGYSEDELIGNNINMLMPEPYHSGHDGYLESYLNTGKAKILGIGREVQGKRKNGEVFPLDLSVVEIKSHGKHYFTGLVRDISERVAMQKQIEINKIRYERSQGFANIGTWDWNILTGELYWSDRIAPLFGYSKGELETTYDNFLAAVHPDDRQSVVDAVNDCVEKSKEYNIEHRCVWPDGSVHWLLEKGDVIRDNDGTPLHMLGVVQDITKRKLAEDALAESAALLKEAQLIGKIGNWSMDVASGEIKWSDEIYRIFGYQPGEFEPTYERFYDAVHPDDIENLKTSEQEAFTRKQPHSIDHRIILSDGSIRWVHEEGHTTFDDNNKAIKFSGTIQDITERKFNEQKLILTNNILQQIASGDDTDFTLNSIISGIEELLDGAICSILMLKDDNRLYARAENRLPDFYNEAIDGLEIGEGIGSCGAAAYLNHRIIIENIHTHPNWENHSSIAKKANLAACWSEPIRSLSARPFGTFAIYYQQPKSPNASELDAVKTAAQLVSIALLREQHENSLLKAKNYAIKANKAKSEFLSNMSHELRTPLNAIIGFSQLLELDEKLQPEQIDSINEIHNAGNHLLELINDVLDLAKIESGSINVKEDVVNLREVVTHCINLTENLASSKNITIKRIAKPSNKELFVIGDLTRLKQAVLNLVSNAIKYNRDNGTVTISCSKLDNEYIEIKISDTGYGLSPEELTNLFTPFLRFGAEKSNIEGTGIGLVITRQLIERMGGYIDVESEKGVGSTFSITLKIAKKDSDNETTNVEDQNIIMPQIHDKKTIVYIEDNPTNLKVVEMSLKKRTNIELLSAEDSETGLDLIYSSKPELILLDINLPGMNGYDIVKELKDNPDISDIPVIAVSANAMETDIEKGRQAGFDDYLTKPIDLTVFYSLLDNYLN